MKDLVIVGVGGMGREVCAWLRDITHANPSFGYRLIGFVDDDPKAHGSRVHDLPVLGATEWFKEHRDVAAALGLGFPAVKRRVAEKLEGWDIELPVIVHPRAIVGENCAFGPGTVVCAGAIVTTDVRIGDGVTVNFGCTIGHDGVIGDFATISPGVNLSGRVRVGEGADIGTGAVVIPGKSIGAWSVIGAGAVVIADVPENTAAVGNPARVTKSREPGWHLR